MTPTIRRFVEEAAGRAVVALLALMVVGALMTAGCLFLGFALFDLLDEEMPASVAALVTAIAFFAVTVIVAVVLRLALTPKRKVRTPDVPVPEDTTALHAKRHRGSATQIGTQLALAALAGYLYQKHPELRGRAADVLLDTLDPEATHRRK